MSENLNEQVIVGFFADAAAADHAADALRNWDKANDDIKLGTMGRITLGEDGKVEAKRYGAARAGRGARLDMAHGALRGLGLLLTLGSSAAIAVLCFGEVVRASPKSSRARPGSPSLSLST